MPEATVLGRDFFQDPLAQLDRLRAEGPVHFVALPSGPQAWVVTDHDEARRLLADPRLSKDRQRRAEVITAHGGTPVAHHLRGMSTHLLSSDPPDHTRLRRLVNRAFTARRVAAMRPRVQQIVTELLDSLPTATEIDLITAFTAPLPKTVICELLGVPERERRLFSDLVDTMFELGAGTAERERSAAAFTDYLREHVARTRAEPDGGLLSALIAARDGEDRLSEDELTSMAGLLLTAGYETTLNLVGTMMVALLTHADQLAAVRADRALVPAAVEESLRYCGPAYLATPRFTLTDIECGPVTVPAGELVYVSLLAANHDPGHVAAPEEFDVTRGDGDPPENLAFGHGIHFCLGAPLARLEAELALAGLLDRFTSIELAVPPEMLRWRESLIAHGFERVPVRLQR